MSIERSIQQAKIQETGEVIKNLDSYFEDRKVSFHIRQEYNRNKINFRCLNCGQKLVVAQSTKHNIYLKHLPNSNYCELKDENLPNRELDTLNNILVAKESERHITLKNRIGELLKQEKNVSNVRIDDHFIFNDKGKKEDLMCTVSTWIRKLFLKFNYHNYLRDIFLVDETSTGQKEFI